MANLHLVTGYGGSSHVTSADAASLNAAIVGSGSYVLNRGNQFAATIVTNNKITIADGDLLMQGRHIRLNEGSTVDLTIESGASGYYRNDLIVARYTKNSSSGVEECNLVVIKGTAVSGTASDPTYTSGDIINDHVLIADMPLYRVPLSGLNVQTLVPLFTVVTANLAGSGNDNQTSLDKTAGKESSDYPGCFYRTVNNETEWINPPMVIGTEYRTSERWGGEPVYAVLVSLGSLPKSGVKKTVAVPISGINHVVRTTTTAVSSSYKCDLSTSEQLNYLYLNNSNEIEIYTSADLSAYTGYADIRYTKN